MYNNMYYEALVEGRYQPRIEVNKHADGDYHAVYEDIKGNRIETVHEDQNEAFRRCNDQIVEGVKQGKLHPFR